MNPLWFVALSFLTGLSQEATAQPGEAYSPKNGQYSIRFPGKPKETTQTAKSQLGDLKVFTATYATAEGNVFMTSYSDFPEAATKTENRGTLFDGIREGLKGKDGKVLSDDDVEIGPDKLPGRDIALEKGKQRIRFRAVLHENRLFQIAIVGTPAFVESKAATAFLESFDVTK